MVTGVGKAGAASAAAAESSQVVNTPMNTGGASDTNGLLSHDRDIKESATAPKFGDVYKQIQAKYGEKPAKPREIKKTLGKDDFLRIMLTQMKNQDPTNPFKAEQMATEIAQFTSVEQLQNINQNLNKMESQGKPFGQMAMTNLIGKVVTIDRDRFPHVEGENESLNFKLPRDSANTHIAILSDTGDVVLEKDLGAEKAGEVTFSWDGIKTNSLPAKAGNYVLRVEAKDDKGRHIETNPQVQSRVIGMSFEGNEPVFLVGDAHHYDKVTMRNIVRVDQEVIPSAAPQNPTPQAQAPVAQNEPGKLQLPANFIPFTRGEGSANFGPGGAPQAVTGAAPETEVGSANAPHAITQEPIIEGGDQK